MELWNKRDLPPNPLKVTLQVSGMQSFVPDRYYNTFQVKVYLFQILGGSSGNKYKSFICNIERHTHIVIWHFLAHIDRKFETSKLK